MRRAAAFALAALLVAACDRAPAPAGPSPAASPVVGTTADEAAARLCTREDPIPGAMPVEGALPTVLADAMVGVEQVRGLSFLEPVRPEPVSAEEISRRMKVGIASMYPAEIFARRSLAWSTIGAIPPSVRIDRAVARFGASRVIGYYDTVSKELVFIGSEEPTPSEEVTLAHELVHALEDQHFDLTRLDRMLADCDDEAFQAALAVVEGSAMWHMDAYGNEILTAEERRRWRRGDGGSGGAWVPIDPFVVQMLLWPYQAGYALVETLEREGGQRAVDGALTALPASTEQVLHPDRYPDDVPIDVDVPDLGPALGADWRDLDVQEVGEAWLAELFLERLDGIESARAAAGWGGARYRAWTDGDAVAVLLITVWDTPEDAEQFAGSMTAWIGAGSSPAAVGPVDGTSVTVWFASDGDTLAALRAATP